MRQTFLFFLVWIFSSVFLFSQEVKKIGKEELKAMLNEPGDKIHVINFWATWCGPCVIEIPYFEKVSKEYPNDKVEFTLASLDFPSQLDSRLIPFLTQQKISLNVVLINEMDYDLWMKDVDPDWKGNIPATLIFNNANKQRQFISKAIDDKVLRGIIDKML